MATVAKSSRSTKITLASATAGPFDLDFRLFDSDAVAVYVNYLPRADWTLSATFVDGFTDSAAITFDAPLEIGDVVVIDSDLFPWRQQDYLNSGNLVNKLNVEFGRIWSSLSDLRRDTHRSARFFDAVSPVAIEGGKLLAVSDDGTSVIMGPSFDDLGLPTTRADYSSQSVGDGTTATFTLPADPKGEKGNIDIFVDRARVPDSEYTLSGLNVTLNDTPSPGSDISMKVKIFSTSVISGDAPSLSMNGARVPVTVATRAGAVAHAALFGGGYPDGTKISWGEGFEIYKSAGATVIDDIPDWLPFGEIAPEHFGAVRDGVTDDLTAIQAAIDFSASSRRFGRFLGGVYAVSGEIVWKEGARFRGNGNWSGVSSTSRDPGTTVFIYTGAGGANSCVVRVSSVAVGTEGSAADQIENMGLTHVTVDGNDTVEFGFYFNRSWSNTQFDFLTATGCTKHGFWAGNCWNASHRNWMAFKNPGSGITLGINTFSWSQCTVDQSVCNSFFGYFSGHNVSTVTLNAFNEIDGIDLEYGIGIGNGRGLVMINSQAAQCSGVGLYLSITAQSPVSFIGGYYEGNGKSTGATRDWDFWYEATPSALNVTLTAVHYGLDSAIKITGTPNSVRREAALKFIDVPIIGTIEADHDKYRLIDCDRDPVAIVGTQPMYFGGRINQAQNLSPIGIVVFYVSGGAIVEVRKEGAISGLTYNGVGDYTLTLSETMAASDWIAQCQATADNRYARAHTYGTTSCRIAHKSLSGIAADPTAASIAIKVVVFPSYL